MWRWWVSTHVSTALVWIGLGSSLPCPSVFWADSWLFCLLPVNHTCPWQFWRTPTHLPQCRSNCICWWFLVGLFWLGVACTVYRPLVCRCKSFLGWVWITWLLALIEQNSTAFWLLESHKLGCSRQIDTLACPLLRPDGIYYFLLYVVCTTPQFFQRFFFLSFFWNVWLWNK